MGPSFRRRSGPRRVATPHPNRTPHPRGSRCRRGPSPPGRRAPARERLCGRHTRRRGRREGETVAGSKARPCSRACAPHERALRWACGPFSRTRLCTGKRSKGRRRAGEHLDPRLNRDGGEAPGIQRHFVTVVCEVRKWEFHQLPTRIERHHLRRRSARGGAGAGGIAHAEARLFVLIGRDDSQVLRPCVTWSPGPKLEPGVRARVDEDGGAAAVRRVDVTEAEAHPLVLRWTRHAAHAGGLRRGSGRCPCVRRQGRGKRRERELPHRRRDARHVTVVPPVAVPGCAPGRREEQIRASRAAHVVDERLGRRGTRAAAASRWERAAPMATVGATGVLRAVDDRYGAARVTTPGVSIRRGRSAVGRRLPAATVRAHIERAPRATQEGDRPKERTEKCRTHRKGHPRRPAAVHPADTWDGALAFVTLPGTVAGPSRLRHGTA